MEDIAKLLIESGCYMRNDSNDKIKTTYGGQVLAYLCCRLAISNVSVRKKIINELAKTIYTNYGSEITIAGMATAGIPWAAGVAEELNSPMLYLRNAAKEYGLKNLIEGNLKYINNNIVVMDDVLYTGQTVQVGIDALKEKGLNVICVSTIAKLSDKAENKFTINDIDVNYLTNYDEILEAAFRSNILNKEEKNKMLKFYKRN